MGRERRSPLPFAAGNVPIIGQTQPRNPLDRPPQVRDLLGRVLHEGDFVTLHTQQPQLFKIERIEPLREEGAPAGLMKMTCTCVAVFASDRDQRNYEFVRVSQAAPTPAQEQPQTAEEIQGDPQQEAKETEQ